MTTLPTYSRDFFRDRKAGRLSSAKAMIPILLDLIHPNSVIDIGCGTGEWLAVCQQHGVDEILGIDGDYVDRSLLTISQKDFKGFDLNKPFTLNRTYDLALCLEVAEHLASESASDFVESLTRVAPVILFSAAIPWQGGTNHVNEQWPEYWVSLFQARGFVLIDALRKRIWSNKQIKVWYRQNALLFCTEQALERNPDLEREFRATNPNMLSIVHPEMYLSQHNSRFVSLWDKARYKPIWNWARKVYQSMQLSVRKDN